MTSISTTQHVHAGCDCRIIRAPVQRLKAILEEGKIPLLRVKTSGTDKLDLGATSFEAGRRYIVVVPSIPDWVASSISNTIATCQLIRMADRLGKIQVEEIRGELYFWLDSLCTPSERDNPEVGAITSIQRSTLHENAYAIMIMSPSSLELHEHTTSENIESYFRSPDWTSQMGRLRGDLSGARILLMASTGFIDLHARLGPELTRAICNPDQEAAETHPDS